MGVSGYAYNLDSKALNHAVNQPWVRQLRLYTGFIFTASTVTTIRNVNLPARPSSISQDLECERREKVSTHPGNQ